MRSYDYAVAGGVLPLFTSAVWNKNVLSHYTHGKIER